MTGAPFTYEDYAALPDDGNRWEVLDGELVMSPSPILIHQAVLRNLHAVVHAHVVAHQLGETFFAPLDVILANTTVVQPDMIFVSTARAAVMTAKNLQGAPDLLVEILSPGTARRDLGIKASLYARYGVAFYWMLDPHARTFAERVLAGGSWTPGASGRAADVVAPACFPGLALDLAAVWA